MCLRLGNRRWITSQWTSLVAVTIHMAFYLIVWEWKGRVDGGEYYAPAIDDPDLERVL